MSTATETTDFPAQATGLMVGFNRHGLPGLVIAALLMMIAWQMWTQQTTTIPALQASTKALTEMSNAVNSLTKTIEDRK